MWTDDRVDVLKSNWAGGASAAQIADRLGGFEHTADKGRSAVLGKVHRLGLSRSRETNAQRVGRIDKRRQARRAATKAAERAAPIAAPTVETVPPVAARPPSDVARVASVLDLEHNHCRWPVGDPLQGFCGADRVEIGGKLKSYCACHHARAHTAAAPRPVTRPTPHDNSRAFANATRWA